MLVIVDSNGIEPEKPRVFWNPFFVVNHEKYVNFILELKRILCQDTSEKESGTFIYFNIIEHGYLKEKYRFNILSQFEEYKLVSNKIFGEENYIPLEFKKLLNNNGK
jgi:hypothetical protein